MRYIGCSGASVSVQIRRGRDYALDGKLKYQDTSVYKNSHKYGQLIRSQAGIVFEKR